jgi:hypothetical protein
MGGSHYVPGSGRAAKRAVIDLGAAAGASRARFVATADFTEFIVKAPSLCREVGPYIPANEMVCAEIAGVLGIPVLPWEFIELPDGDLGFGSLRMTNADFASMSEPIANQIANPELFSSVAVFDLWVCNTDRHAGNLLARRGRDEYTLLANDHSHTLIREHMDPATLADSYSRLGPEAFFRSGELRARVMDCRFLRDTLGAVEAFDEQVLRSIVSSVPVAWMSEDVKSQLSEFLLVRARTIRSIFQGVSSFFPKLAGVAL